MIRKCFLWMTILMMLFCSAVSYAAEGGVKVPEISYITRYDIPDNEAMAFLKNMGVGWNLGNTFDAHQDPLKVDEMKVESLWVGIKTTKEMLEKVQDAGFSTLRLPVSWHNQIGRAHV